MYVISTVLKGNYGMEKLTIKSILAKLSSRKGANFGIEMWINTPS